MEQYLVTGMTCAACQARVEKAVSKVQGVESCSVSLLTNSMGVEGSADSEDIVRAVENAGYKARIKGKDGDRSKSDYLKKLKEDEEALKDRETPVLKKRLLASIVFLIVLMYFSMGHSMLSLPLPSFFQGNPLAIGLIQLLLAAIVMVINQKFFISGFKSLFNRSPNMDSLIALGSSAAFIYSVIMLFIMTGYACEGDMERAKGLMHEFYFESAAMILTLITVGKMLEAHSKGKTTDALKSLMKLAPKTANVIREGKEFTVSIEEVEIGDIFVVRPGESIPVDGVVIEGEGAVNEASLTGESIPLDKKEGDRVSSATINQSGFLKCRAERIGEDTTLSKIIQMVSDAAATKAPVAKLADRISGIFVPTVIVIALLTCFIWLILGESSGFAMARGICVLVVSCPCALGLATPVSIMVGNGVGARNGILFKNAESLQETGNIKIAALDKTGTITKGEPEVTDLICMWEGDKAREDFLTLAYHLEKRSEHPLAGAVVKYVEREYAHLVKREPDIKEFKAISGNGLRAVLVDREGKYHNPSVNKGKEGEDKILCAGNLKFIREEIRKANGEDSEKLPGDLEERAARLADEGKTPMFFTLAGEPIGMIAVSDVIKEDSRRAIEELKNMGIYVVMLTGDNERSAKAIGKEAGVNEVVASVLPQGKEAVIKELKEYGKVLMIGDGINDAPALTRADIGMAIGGGTDVAIDSADVVLMKSNLSDAAAAIRLSRRSYTNIKENLFWALIYNSILIPTAAGVFSKSLGITMNPMLGALAMSLSSFCVVSNALRLNTVRIKDASRDKRIKDPVRPLEGERLLSKSRNKDDEMTEKNKGGYGEMTKTVKIEGMMCEHCEARVKKTLEKLDFVEEAKVSHKEGSAILTLKGDMDEEVVKAAIEDQDYKFLGIE
ncbi:MAG: heavy metal translocating P-type ATPase [Lachnospiraceae bacterium]|nr:heavy metal translocating P-type ATPase [Lachnospiraceae bacterium]